MGRAGNLDLHAHEGQRARNRPSALSATLAAVRRSAAFFVAFAAIFLAIASAATGSLAHGHGHSHGDGGTCTHSHGHGHGHSHGGGHGHSHGGGHSHAMPSKAKKSEVNAGGKKVAPAKEDAKKAPAASPSPTATGLPPNHPPVAAGSDASSCPYAKLRGAAASIGLGGLVGGGVAAAGHGSFGGVSADGAPKPPRSLLSIAAEAACASLATSLLPIIVILVCPLNWRALRLFVAFASGALIADVFTHQLPSFIGGHHSHSHSHGGGDDHGHSHGGDDHGHSHSGGGGGLGAIGFHSVVTLVSTPLFRCAVAIMGTYLVDVFVYSRMMAKAKRAEAEAAEAGADSDDDSGASPKKKKAAHHGHGHSHGSESPFSPPEEEEDSKEACADKKKATKKSNATKKGSEDNKQKKDATKSSDDTVVAVSHHSASAAIVDLFADTLHNFTDGLTLGASFLKGPRVGWNTTLLVLLHEVPHELGDGALLVRGGWTRWEAAKVQVWTGLGNLMGTMVILFLNPDQRRIDEWVTPVVAGSFLYVALTGMLGELKEVPPLSVANTFQLLGEAFMFLAGLAFLEIVVHSGMH